MSAQALVCPAPGSGRTEATIVTNLLVRDGVKVTTASVASDDDLATACLREVKLLMDTPLVEVVNDDFDIIVLPSGIKGAECFRDGLLLIETVEQSHRSGHVVTATCAAAAAVFVPHNTFLVGSMTGFLVLKDQVPTDQWQDKRVVWGPRINLLASQGPGTSIDLGLKIIDPLVNREKAHEMASQLATAMGIHNYYEQIFEPFPYEEP